MEKTKNIKKELLVILIGGIIFFILGVITGYITSSNQENKLRKEVDKISKMNITIDNVDMEIKTKGDYAVIEQTIKEYMNKYFEIVKQVYNILNDDNVGNILTAENYKNDGPEFIQTKAYITESKTKFNEGLDTLIEMSSEETIMKAIQDKQLDEKYTELYKELMLGNEEFEKDLDDAINTFKDSKEMINKIFDIEEKIIDMLINNKGKWSINENNEIAFDNNKLVNEYNGYLEEL